MSGLFLLLVVSCLAFLATCQAFETITITSRKPVRYVVGAHAGKSFLATATYSDANNHTSNFGLLEIQSSSDFSDNDQFFGTGFAEGHLTAERIYQHYQNMMCQVDCSGNVPAELEAFFKEQDAWAKSQVLKYPNDPFWMHIGNLQSQMEGLIEGYSSSTFGSANPLSEWAFVMINSMGDLFDIIPAVTPSRRPDFAKMSYGQAKSYLTRVGHCSALIKVTDDLSDMYIGHNAWFVYSSMLRIYKTYHFNLSNPGSKATITSFSSYPASLSSLDDFYMMSGSNLIMTQTTNNIFNSSLWDLVVPQSLLAWQRVRTANQLADSGKEWFDHVSRYNSGTYNNQYMVIDMKKFVAGSALQPGTLFVVEQVPGLMSGADVTDELVRGYWPSYNVPYFQDIYVRSGYPSLDEKGGVLPFTQYQQAPRAKIFRRDQSGVHDLATMQKLMRSNNFQTDPYAEGDPWGAISARGDLAKNPYPAGGYDTKITSASMFFPNGAVKMQASIVNGPTSTGQAPFKWSTSGLTDSHVGQPDVFDFDFELVSLEN